MVYTIRDLPAPLGIIDSTPDVTLNCYAFTSTVAVRIRKAIKITFFHTLSF